MLRGIDMRECDDPDSSFTLRRLFVAYSGLPRINSVSVAISGITQEESSWSPATHVMANVFDAIQQLTYLTEMINTPKGKQKPKAPKPHPRPGMRNAARPRRGDWFPGQTIISR